MLNAILWLDRSGAVWKDILKCYSPKQSVYSRFCKWRDDGMLETVFHALNADADLENLSTVIEAHPQSVEAKRTVNLEFNQFIGTSRGGKATKIHTIADRLEDPISFLLSGGQIHDSKIAVSLHFFFDTKSGRHH